MIRQFAGLALAIVSLGGCSFDTTSQEGSNESVGVVQEEARVDWSPTPFGPHTVGMAANSNFTVYQWTDLQNSDGTYVVCRGGSFNPCSQLTYRYVSAVPATEIMAVGISRTNGHVYAWYNHNNQPFFSEGTSDNLGALQPFLLPKGVSMANLVEADMSDNRSWYFYWRLSNGTIHLSNSATATSGGDNVSVSNVNVAPSPNNLIGVLFGNDSPATIWSFYSDSTGAHGKLSASNNSMDLFQL